jgi:hypothetical protein
MFVVRTVMYNVTEGSIPKGGIMDVSEWICEDFLDVVWGERRGYVDLPSKVGQYWVPYHFRWHKDDTAHVTRRINAALRDEESMYFSAGMFRERGRNYEDMMKSSWLWADLDDVNPEQAAQSQLMPTLAWESSPDRYQAMWKLTRAISPEWHDRVNQALSYHLGADVGGWDRTQVLRLPFTKNYKYDPAPTVKLMWYEEDLVYKPRYVWDVVKASALPITKAQIPEVTTQRPMPGRARALLRVPANAVVEGERSEVMWKIECLLAEAGWGEDDIYAVVSECAWNKWAGMRSEERQLKREINKAQRHVRVRPLPPLTFQIRKTDRLRPASRL